MGVNVPIDEAFALTLLEASPDCLKLVNFDGFVEYINQIGVDVMALSSSNEVVGQKWETMWPAAEWPKIRHAIAAAQLGQKNRFVGEAQTNLGVLKVWDVSVAPVPGADGKPFKLLATSRDITEAKRASEMLDVANQSFRQMVESSPFGLCIVDSDFRLAYVSAGAQNAFAAVYPYVGRDFAEIMHEMWEDPYASNVITAFKHTLETGEDYNASDTIEQRKDIDKIEAYDWKIDRVLLPDGRYGVICNFYDLTERTKQDAALLESEARFRGTFENAAVGVAHVALDGTWLDANKKLSDIVGYSREELLSKSFQDITHPDDMAEDLEQVRRMIAGDINTYAMDKRYIHKSGTIIWAGLTVSLHRFENGQPHYFISVVRDISERVKATQELIESQGRLSHAAESAKLSYAVIDLLNGQIKASHNHDRVMGFFIPGIVDGADTTYVTSIFLAHVVEADRQRVKETLLQELQDVIVPKIEYRVIGDDREERSIVTRSTFEKSQESRPSKIFTTYSDITEQKKSEERIRLLMYEVNHRAKNMLAVVQAVARQTAKSGEPGTFVDRLSDRIAGLAASQDLLVTKEWKGVSIADLVRAQIRGFSDQVGTQIVFDGPELNLTPSAAQAIGMALHELATNAYKYGSLSIAAGRVILSWDISGGSKDIFSMTWMESGGPEVTLPKSYGFGQKVIIQMVQSSLNGEAELEYHAAGLVWRLQSPVASTLTQKIISKGTEQLTSL